MMKFKLPVPNSRTLLFITLPAVLVFSAFSGNLDPYFAQVIVFIAINIILAVSLNLVIGETGQFSLCHAAFMAIGAYASALLTSNALPAMFSSLQFTGVSFWSQALFLPVLVGGGLAAAVAGLLVGIPSLRLRGDYLALVTLGFGEIVRVFIENTPLLSGASGMTGIQPCTNLFWALGMAAVTVYVASGLSRSTFGSGFHAVRDDEIAAEAMGINTTKYKITAFVTGAFFAGIAGGLYAHEVQYINPDGFTFLKSFEVIVMVILGGMGSVPGVAAAAVLITILNEALRDLAQYRMVTYALLIILLMILRPQGILRGIERLLPRRHNPS